MKVSEQLDKAAGQLKALAGRADEAERHLQAAKTEGQQDLAQDVAAAKKSAKSSADKLKSVAADKGDEASQRWADVQNSWKAHIDKLRHQADEEKANLDAKRLERRAERAEDDAEDAVNYALAAFEEAEYLVLNAALARMDANTAAQN